MVIGGHRLAAGPEQSIEPAIAERHVRRRECLACVVEHTREPAQRDPLLVLVSRDRARDAGQFGLQLLTLADQVEAVGVELRACRGVDLPEFFAIGVGGQNGKLRLGGAEG